MFIACISTYLREPPLHLLCCPLQLTDTKWGVIGLQRHAVPCDYKPANPAPAPAHPTPGQKPPKGTEQPPPGYWNKPGSHWPGKSGSLESNVDVSMRLPGYAVMQTHILAFAECSEYSFICATSLRQLFMVIWLQCLLECAFDTHSQLHL